MNSLFRIIVYGIQGFRRNIWLSIIAIITMTLTVTTITVFALGNVVANKKYQEQNDKIDYNIFIRDEASDADVAQFRTQVTNRPEVEKIVFVSKEDARKNFDQFFGSEADFKGLITDDNNPLLREIDVKFKDPNQIDSFNQFVSQDRFQQIIYRTSYIYNRNLISNYLRLTNLIRVFGISFTVFFVMIAILVILNTIRLAIYSRREEVEIMRLVGATRGYVRGPFLIEGILFGLIGALIAGIITWTFLHQLQIVLASSFNDQTTNFVSDLFGSSFGSIANVSGFNALFAEVLLSQIVVGLALGLACSLIAIRRYLKE